MRIGLKSLGVGSPIGQTQLENVRKTCRGKGQRQSWVFAGPPENFGESPYEKSSTPSPKKRGGRSGIAGENSSSRGGEYLMSSERGSYRNRAAQVFDQDFQENGTNTHQFQFLFFYVNKGNREIHDGEGATPEQWGEGTGEHALKQLLPVYGD